MSHLKEHAVEIFNKAVESVQPSHLIENKVQVSGDRLTFNGHETDLSKYENIYVLGFGKAAAYMATALEKKLGDKISGGAVIVKYGHTSPCDKIDIYEAGHPVPDDNTIQHSEKLVEIADNAGENDLVICLISGGGSALFEVLPQKISLDNLKKLNDLLLNSGANIHEINTVRRHISKVKGGQLLRTIYPASCESFIISDVMNDPLKDIASGPTASDDTTFYDARKVIEKYRLDSRVPTSVLVHLEVGAEGKVSETVRETENVMEKVNNHLLGNISLAMKAAKEKAEELGCRVVMENDLIRGEASALGESIANKIIKQMESSDGSEPVCFILGGETTVKHTGKGKGGRNQEMALAAYVELQEAEGNFALLCAGTDGTDGPTDAAGAVVTKETVKKAKDEGLEPESFLVKHDSYTFFEKTDSLLKTGPTGTNVMDLVIAVIE